MDMYTSMGVHGAMDGVDIDSFASRRRLGRPAGALVGRQLLIVMHDHHGPIDTLSGMHMQRAQYILLLGFRDVAFAHLNIHDGWDDALPLACIL